MDNNEPDFDSFEKALDQRSLLYYWHLRSQGYEVENKIETLERKIYGKDLTGDILWQRDIDELQLLLAIVDLESERNSAFVTKAVVYKLKEIKVIIKPDKNHFRPHFHVHYKKGKYQASYAIDSFERLAGAMPKKYEEPILEWAMRMQKSLRLTWNELKQGKDVRGLVLHADES